MAKLYYSSSLTLNLWEASDKQRNGEAHVIGASVPVTKRFYDLMFAQLSSNKKLLKALRKITSKKIESLWQTFFDSSLSGVHIQQGRIKVIPCIQQITPSFILVALPFYIEGATSAQIEWILKKCLEGDDVLCTGNEIHIRLDPSPFCEYDTISL